MLQLIFAVSLQEHVPGLQVYGYDMPLWNLSNIGRLGWKNLTPSIRLRETDGLGLAELFRSGSLRRAKLQDVPLRCTLFAPPSRFQDLFQLDPTFTPSTNLDEILINVRGAEVLGSVHGDYGPIPLNWYQKVLADTGLRPVFLGQLGDDYYSHLLRDRFPDARFLPSRGPMADFAALRLAQHIAVSVSTFSWLGAWLSRAASIHLPLFGIFNPAQRSDIWMLPFADPRYRFYEFPVRKWSASSAQIAELSAEFPVNSLSSDAVVNLAARLEADRHRLRDKAFRSLRRRALLSFLPQIGA